MKQQNVYLLYGLILMILGLLGFYLTHAKSALISGLASAALMIGLSFLTKNSVALMITRGLNLALLGVFVWRSSLAISAVSAGSEEKFIPAILLSLMALVSIGALAVSLLSPKYPEN